MGEYFMRKYTEDEKFMKEAIKQAKKAELAVLLFMMEK
jgi:hypothetical protein